MPNYIIVGGGLIVTPGMTQNQMDELSADIKRLVNEMIEQDAPDSIRKGFASFAVEWNNYKQENSGWWNRGLSSTYAEVQKFRERYNGWQKKFAQLPGKVTSTRQMNVEKSVVEETLKSGVEAIKGAPAAIKWVGIGLLAVGGAAGIYYITRK